MKFYLSELELDPSLKHPKKGSYLIEYVPGNRAANQISRMRFSRPFFIF